MSAGLPAVSRYNGLPAESQGFSLPSDQWGKAKTTIQILAIWMVIFYWPGGPQWMLTWGYWIMWVAVVISAYSGLIYFIEFNRLLKASQAEPETQVNPHVS